MLKPETEAQLAEIVRGANAPLSLRGGGTRHQPLPGEALTTSGMRGISLYEPGALTLVAHAGTPLAEVEEALAAEKQCLPFEPMDHRGLLGTEGEPTIGGVVAMNVAGPRRMQAGGCRDSLIGVRFVTGTGEIIKNGGRVMKNVTGFDLVKLMAGSRGHLGVLTEVAFKVLPAPEAQATLSVPGLEAGDAVAAMAAALGSPFEVTGAAWDGRTHLRIEGLSGSVDYRTGKLSDLLARWGAADVTNGADSAALWREIRDAKAVAGEGDVWRVHCRPSQAPHLLAAVSAQATLLDWGGGLIWLRVAPGTNLRAALPPFDGHASRVTGAPDLPPQPVPLQKIEEGLRAKFDPRGLFSPVIETA